MSNITEILSSYRYSTNVCKNKSTSNITKIWVFYKNNEMMQIKHECHEMNIMAFNTITKKREFLNTKKEKFYEFNSNTQQETEIKDINSWLDQNLQYIIASNQVYNNVFNIINYIKEELGEHSFSSYYEMGWSVPNFYKLTINLYNGTIMLICKNKELILTQSKLETFIQKNKESIKQAKEKEYQKYMKNVLKIREEQQIQELQIQTQKLNITKPTGDSSKKVGYNVSSNSLFIPRTLKQKYETQACKPFPMTYLWESS